MGVDLLNVKGLEELDPLAPVVMVNLMRFRERSLDGCGSGWDYLALVYYPTVAAFIEMMTSKDYENRCDPHRTNGCAEHVIIATKEAYSKFKVP